jgi:hypothetical protein
MTEREAGKFRATQVHAGIIFFEAFIGIEILSGFLE